jgi:hypothetical protein
MTIGAARLGLAAAAFAFVAAGAVLPAAAQTETYPPGTDCSKLVGNSKTACDQQQKMSGSTPDNSNNPSNSEINTTTGTNPAGSTNSMPSSTTTPNGEDCTKLVGNSKKDCEARAKNSPNPDNSNNPSQQTN